MQSGIGLFLLFYQQVFTVNNLINIIILILLRKIIINILNCNTLNRKYSYGQFNKPAMSYKTHIHRRHILCIYSQSLRFITKLPT